MRGRRSRRVETHNDNEVNNNLVKGGEQMLQISLRRSTKGVTVSVKTHPLIENFFRQQGGETIRVNEMGREWHGKNLVAYLTPPTGTINGAAVSFTVDELGRSLVRTDGRVEVVNISFLRMVGVSEGEGITFEIRGAFSLKYIQNLANKLVQASRQFYIDFLRPVDVTVTVNTQETRL